MRCVQPIMESCTRHALSWIRLSLYNFLLPTAKSIDCVELGMLHRNYLLWRYRVYFNNEVKCQKQLKSFFIENHTAVGYPFEKMCSTESLSNCMQSMFTYRAEKPLFPDIQTLELAFKTKDDFTAWCGYVKYI